MRIAYITYSGAVKYSAANGFNEQADLLPFLQQKGLDIEAVIWDDATVDWTEYDVALLKTPWDYHTKITAFTAWLNKIESLQIRLLNSYELVRQNIDKHYLKDIINRGMAVIPSVFLEQGWRGDLDALFTALHSDAIIVKPCVSGGSKDTVVIQRKDAASEYEQIAGLLTKGDFIAQPLMKEVEEGEWSFIFFNGHYSHTILKKPKKGDFRVQQIYGGTIETLYPTPVEIQKAAAYVNHFAKGSLYARVDGLIVNGEFVLMELELTEPFLYLAYSEGAVERYYQALVAQLGNQ